MSYIKNAIKNTSTLLGYTLVSTLIAYLLRIYLSHNMSVEEYGLIYGVINFTLIFVILFGFGISPALSTFIPKYLVKKKKLEIRSTIAVAFIIQLTIVSVIAITVFIYANDISVLVFKTTAAAEILKVIMLSLLLSPFYTIFNSTFLGFQKIKLCSLMDPVKMAVVAAASVALIGMGALGVAYAYLIAAVAIPILFFIPFAKLFDSFSVKISFDTSKTLMLFGAPILIGYFANFIISYADTILLAAFTDLRQAGLYQAALPTSQLLWLLAVALSAIALPLISELNTKKSKEDLSKTATFFANTPFFLLIPFAMILFTFPEIILTRLFGGPYLYAADALRILVIGAVFYTPFLLFQNMLIAMGRPALNTKIIIAVSLVDLGLNLVLIPRFGAVGAAVTSSTTYIIGTILSYYFLRKLVKIKVYYVKLMKIVSVAIATVIFIFLLKQAIFTQNELLEAIVDLTAGFIFYMILIIKTKAVTKEDVDYLRENGINVPRWLGI